MDHSEGGRSSGPNASALTYDPLARLYQLTSGAATTRFGYDGLNMLGEYNGSNALQRRYVFAPGLDRPILWYEGAGTTDRRFMSADERGSIISVSDSSGAALSTNGYDEYGIPQSPASASAGSTGVGTLYGRFGYTGQAWLPEVGLYYYKARMYSPTLGRFLQTDPIGYADGANWYAYVKNDPVNSSDPLGLDQTIICTGSRIPSCGGGGLSTGNSGSSSGSVTGRIEGGSGSASAGLGTGLAGQVTETEWFSYPSGVTSYTYSYWLAGDPFGAAFQFASFGGSNDAGFRVRASWYLRNAVVAALMSACKCQINPSNIVPLNWNFSRVIDPSQLPNIFGISVSFHSAAQSANIGFGYELKYYSSERTITITTFTWSYEHILGIPSFLLGEPVNTINARGYCYYSGNC